MRFIQKELRIIFAALVMRFCRECPDNQVDYFAGLPLVEVFTE